MKVFCVDDKTIGLFFIITSSIATAIYILRLDGVKKEIKMIILVGFLIRMILVFIDVFVSRIVDAGTDDDGFYNTSILYYENNYTNLGEITRGGLFPKMLSLSYYCIGSSRFSAQYLNVLFYAISSVVFVKALINLNVSDCIMKYAMLIFCLLPNGILNNSVLRRETIMGLCVSSSLYFLSKWYKNKRFVNAFFVIVFTAAASLFHTAFIFGVPIFIIYFALYDRNKKAMSFSIDKLSKMLILMVCAVIVGVGFLSLWKNKFTNISDMDDIYTTVSREGGGSAYLVGYEINGIGQLILFTPLKLFYFLFSPVPWSFRGFMDVASFFLDVLVYAVLLIKDIRMPKDSLAKLMLVMFIAMSAIFGLGTFNSGTAIRHRYSLLPYLLISYAIVETRESKKQNRNLLERKNELYEKRRTQ